MIRAIGCNVRVDAAAVATSNGCRLNHLTITCCRSRRG